MTSDSKKSTKPSANGWGGLRDRIEAVKAALYDVRDGFSSAEDVMKGKPVNALHGGGGIQVDAGALTDLISKAILGTDHLGKLAKTDVGGYLERIMQVSIATKLAYEKGDAVAANQGKEFLIRIQSLLQKWDAMFDTQAFIDLVEKAATKSIVKAATGQTPIPGGATGGLRFSFGGQSYPDRPSLDTLVSTGRVRGG